MDEVIVYSELEQDFMREVEHYMHARVNDGGRPDRIDFAMIGRLGEKYPLLGGERAQDLFETVHSNLVDDYLRYVAENLNAFASNHGFKHVYKGAYYQTHFAKNTFDDVATGDPTALHNLLRESLMEYMAANGLAIGSKLGFSLNDFFAVSPELDPATKQTLPEHEGDDHFTAWVDEIIARVAEPTRDHYAEELKLVLLERTEQFPESMSNSNRLLDLRKTLDRTLNAWFPKGSSTPFYSDLYSRDFQNSLVTEILRAHDPDFNLHGYTMSAN